MSKQVKKFELDALRKAFGGVKDYVLIEPLKVDAATDFEFRKTLRGKKVRVQLVKNTLAQKIFAENGVTVDGVWSGPTLLCWGANSPKELGTAVDDQLKASKKDPKAPDKYKVKTGVVEGQAMALDVMKTVPTREEAIGDVLGALLGPGASIVGAITGPATQLAGILKAIEEKAPAGEATPASEPAAAG